MPLDLTDLDRRVLRHAPLATVICQVRYNVTSAASDLETARSFQQRLAERGLFDRLDQIVESTLNVAVAPHVAPAVAQGPLNTGWRLTAADGTRLVSLLPTHFAVEATAYNGWEEDFAPLLYEVLDAVVELVQPVFEQRLGLRYVNQLTHPEVVEAAEWRGWIDESFLAMATHDELGPMLTFLRQQAILQLDGEARCTVNSGFSPDPDRDGALTFLLDFDIAREGTRGFDAAQIRETLDLFNSYALRLFQIATSPRLREALAHG